MNVDDIFEFTAQPLPHSSSYAAAVLVLLFIYFLVRLLVTAISTKTESFPVAGQLSSNPFSKLSLKLSWTQNGFKHIQDAFDQHPNEIFRLPSLDRPQIVLPPQFLSEIKDLPKSMMDVGRATADFFAGNWTTMDDDVFRHATVDAVSAQFISRINHQIAPSVSEATYAFDQAFTDYPEWTPVMLQPTITPIVAQTMARTLVGPELCRKSEWFNSVIQYSQNVFMAAVYLKAGPPIMRPLLSMLIPYTYRIQKYRRKIHQLASSQIKQALERKKSTDLDHTKHEHRTSVDWLVQFSPDGEATPEMIAHRLTGISLGATHTTSAQITNCVLDLANEFDKYAGPLREEIDTVLGSDQTQITNTHLAKMWKLDSFMKETQRFHPISALSVNRTLVQPYRLSTGTLLPKGTHVSFAGGPMSQSDTYVKDGKTFDGFRFERMRHDPLQSNNGLPFTSSYEGTLHFGAGRQACPGRFLGGAVCKIVLIKLLQRYDFKLAQGQSRPDDLTFMDMIVPHPDCQVLFKDRES